MTGTHSPRAVAGSVLGAARAAQLTLLAAAIAYYAFVSMVPLVVLGVAAASVLGGDGLARAAVASLEGFVTPEAMGLVEAALTSDAGRSGASAAGLTVLAWSGLRVFRGLDVAFSRIYGAPDRESLLGQLRDALVVLVAMGLAAAAVAFLTAIPLAGLPVPARSSTLVGALVLPVVFLPVYYVFPDHPIGLREALPGAILAGVGWTALAAAFSAYATYAGSGQLYGALGGVLLVLAWFYAGGLLVLLGATLNATLAGERPDRQLQHEPRRRVSQRGHMSDGDDPTESATDGVDAVDTREIDHEEFLELRDEVEDLAADLESKTKARADLESDLRRYVRWRQRRGHARGWGPYLVLLYGTIMTLGAFYFLSGGWAVLAMLVVWLSTLGLYTLMVIFGAVWKAVGVPGRLVDRLRGLR